MYASSCAICLRRNCYASRIGFAIRTDVSPRTLKENGNAVKRKCRMSSEVDGKESFYSGLNIDIDSMQSGKKKGKVVNGSIQNGMELYNFER